MRILGLVSEFPPYRGGIATYAANLAAAAAALGADITVAAPDYGCQDLNDSEYDFEIIRFPGGQHSARDHVAKWQVARRLISRGGWDLVHAMDWPFFVPVGFSTPRTVPRMLTVHGSDVVGMTAGHRRAAMRVSGILSGNVTVLGNSAFTANLFRRHFPAAAHLARHELLGVSPFWLDTAARGPSRRASLGLPPDAFVVTTVARLSRRKGHLGVIKALGLLPDRLRERVFHAIVGPSVDDGYSREVDAALAATPVAARRFGAVPDTDLRDFYANSDVFCLVGQPVSDRTVEGFGLVFLEAGGQGLPSIAGDIGGVAEVVEQERSGLTVPVSNPEAVAAALVRLMEDPVLLSRCAAGARARAAELSWRRCAAATYGLSAANAPTRLDAGSAAAA